MKELSFLFKINRIISNRPKEKNDKLKQIKEELCTIGISLV